MNVIQFLFFASGRPFSRRWRYISWILIPITVAFSPIQNKKCQTAFLSASSNNNICADKCVANYELVQELTASVFKEESSLSALDQLGELIQKPQTYQFDSPETDRIVSYLPQLIPNSVVNDEMKTSVAQATASLSTNPDSVDGLPSFHLNLVSNGKPSSNDKTDILSLASPSLDSLVEHAEQLMPTSSPWQVDEVFVRCYGGGGDSDSEQRRRGLSAHYDVTSRLTCVIALDDSAATGENGLYTFPKNVLTNHAALRQYFPLSCGDAVVHTWDVLHGVWVEPQVERTSLIVWLTTKDSWLQEDPERLSRDSINQFVWASALESSADRNEAHDPLDWYLSSAQDGSNSFALVRLGSACTDGSLSESQIESASAIARTLNKNDNALLDQLLKWTKSRTITEKMSITFWLSASFMGNPLAQVALANAIMVESHSDSDARLAAGRFFALAAQQGDDNAVESLTRVVELEMASGGISNQEDFETSPLIQAAQIATRYLDG